MDGITSGGNYDLITSALSWLGGEAAAVSVEAKSLAYTPLVTTASDVNLWGVILIGVIPAATLLVGIIVWVRRKTMKNKQAVKMVGALVILAALIGTYFAVKALSMTAANKDADEGTITVNPMNSEDIQKFSYIYEGETITFVKEADTWYYDGDRNFPVDQSALASKLTSVCSMSASRSFEAQDDALAEYGLDEPSNKITLTDRNGKETILEVGDKNNLNNEYYCRVNGENTIYTVGAFVSTSMAFDLYSVVDMASFPYISSDQMTSVKVDHNGTVTTYSSDSEDAASRFTAASGLYYTSHVDYNCTDPARYGLDQPQYKITIEYTQDHAESETDTVSQSETETVSETENETGYGEVSVLTLYVGHQTDDGYYYVCMEGSSEVNLMSETLLSGLVE